MTFVGGCIIQIRPNKSIRDLMDISMSGSNIKELIWIFSDDINKTLFSILMFSVSLGNSSLYFCNNDWFLALICHFETTEMEWQ